MFFDKSKKRKDSSDRNEELMVNNSRKMNEIDKMLTLLLENSNFNETYKQKIFHATLMVHFYCFNCCHLFFKKMVF